MAVLLFKITTIGLGVFATILAYVLVAGIQ